MRIKADTKFREGYDTFEKDVEYDVPDEQGYYFCRVGWATNLDAPVEKEEQPAEVDLDIHNSSHVVKDSNG